MKKFKKYKFKPYNKNFPILYKREKQKLKKFFPKNVKIEHIGSTSIPNLGGKGIIDICISAQKRQLNKIIRKLEENGYEYIIEGGDKERKFFQKDCANKTRRIHIQLTFNNSSCWKNAIAFRDYLIKHKDKAKEYEKIKKQGAKISLEIGRIYREYKKDFIDKLTKQALKAK